MIRFSENLKHQELYYAIFSILIIITLFSLLLGLVGKSRKRILIVNLLMFVIEFIYLLFIYEGYSIKIYSLHEKVSKIGNILYNMPLLFAWIILILLLISTILCIIYSYHWSKRHLGKTSIKEGIDKLPTGLCFYSSSGIPMLTNTAMNDICSIITGQSLMNGKMFYDECTKGLAKEGNIFIQTGNVPIIKLKNGMIKSIKCNKIEDDVYELIATDVTKEYELGIELRNRNEELKEMNARLLEYGKHIEIITRDKEILNVKIRIHDELGHLLLLSKKIL